MTQRFQSGSHLDADQLAAFTEGSLTEREHRQTLAHLSECDECRNVVFLMQDVQPVREAAPAIEPVPFWQRFTPFAYTAGMGACLAAISIFVWMHHSPSPTGSHTEVARNSTASPSPTPELNGNLHSGASTKTKTSPASRKASPQSAPVVAQNKRVTSETEQAKDSSASPSIATGSSSAVNRTTDASQTAGASSPAPPPVAGAQVQNLPLNSRSVTAPLTQSSAGTALFSTSRPLSVRIEHGQAALGTLARVEGTVVDVTGAVIPRATVTLQQNGKPSKQTTTNESGQFTLSGVSGGLYEVEIAAPGFQTAKQTLNLQANDLALLTSQLPVGSASQTVEVTSAAPMLQTESASVASVMNLPRGRKITNTISQGKRLLALDADGSLYLSANDGKSWKRVKAHWTGKITEIEAADSGTGFEVTTDSKSVWLSENGKHWRQR